MNIVADLEIEEDEAAEDARRQELLALEWELDSDGGDTDADSAAEDNVDILNENKKIKDELGAVDHSLVMTGGDHFASYYSVKVESFLRQAFVQANPRAFRSSNPNRLIAGVDIRLPTAEDVLALIFFTSPEVIADSTAQWISYP